jgi:hypothetical protein
MDLAYKVAARVVKTILSPEQLALINQLQAKDLIIVPGLYDFVEKILASGNVPYSLHKEDNKSQTKLNPAQILLINCPGSQISALHYKKQKGLKAVVEFVKDGGFLVSTDWALDHIIPGFEGFIAHGGNDTSHDVVEIDLVAHASPYMQGLGSGSLKPLWWLESASYPIKILKKNKVDVLLASQEMRQKYGEEAIAVKFAYGEGRVIHVVSHFYLQYIKTKYEAQASKTGIDFLKAFLNMSKKDIEQIQEVEKISFGALESAYTSVRFLCNIFLEKAKKNKQRPPYAQKTKPLSLD